MINTNYAYLTYDPDGTQFQVVLPDNSDWDEAATYAALNAYIASLSDQGA